MSLKILLVFYVNVGKTQIDFSARAERLLTYSALYNIYIISACGTRALSLMIASLCKFSDLHWSLMLIISLIIDNIIEHQYGKVMSLK